VLDLARRDAARVNHPFESCSSPTGATTAWGMRCQPLPTSRTRVWTLWRVLTGAAVAGLLSACATGPGASSPPPSSESASSPDGAHSGGSHSSSGTPMPAALPSSHVHGVGIDPGDGLIYLATHDGLFRYDATGAVRVGQVNDLMGFTIAGPGHFYASGHPGAGSDLPNPVGLIESRDGGKTWTQLSRQGQSDFHALTASSASVIGFDGTLRTSADGTSWSTLQAPAQPYSLTSSPRGDVVLATSEDGPIRSTDGGRSWAKIPAAPLLLLVAWASGSDTTAAAITPDGEVFTSTDAGLTWTPRARIDGNPQALGASIDGGDGLRVQVVDEAGVLTSTDGGSTFAPLPAAATTTTTTTPTGTPMETTSPAGVAGGAE
jgi:hypothetical protein